VLPAGQEGFEYHVLMIGMALAIVVSGSGAWSVDRVLARVRGGQHTAVKATLTSVLMLTLIACDDAGTGPGDGVWRVIVAPDSAVLTIGEHRTLAAKVIAEDSTILSRAVAWSSSNVAVATVDGQGVVTAHKEGTVTITAKSQAKSGRTHVRVVPWAPAVAIVQLSPRQMEMLPDQTRQLHLTVRSGDAEVIELPSGTVVTYASSDTTVAVVSGTGLVQTRRPGWAAITATVSGISGLMTVTVAPPIQSSAGAIVAERIEVPALRVVYPTKELLPL
jgi:hypothetical protein